MKIRTSISDPIAVNWIALDLPGKVGLTLAPGKHCDSLYSGGRWERDLVTDLDSLVQDFGMQVEVCLLEDHELVSLEIPTLIDDATARGVRVLRLPIPDAGTLRHLEHALPVVDEIVSETRKGSRVVIHCAGGLGRAGTIGGCVLARLGTPTAELFDILRKARGPHCPETQAQRDFVRRFAAAFGGGCGRTGVRREALMSTTWFESLTGFAEGSYADTQAKLVVEGSRLTSTVNGQSYGIGTLTVPSLDGLRARVTESSEAARGRLSVAAMGADVSALHRDPANRQALFQVASQFNLLEMVGPDVSPEDGVTRYAHDHTQGPACAIAAGAATIYRNYFADVDGQQGQTSARQIDCLRDLGSALGNDNQALWQMRNGYALCTSEGLDHINRTLASASEVSRDELRGLLRIGVHSDVQVTNGAAPDQHLSQAFCSALPVAYSRVPRARWEAFARLVLEAAYEATMCAAALNAQRFGSNLLFLTRLGGGAFGNEPTWIDDAIRRALRLAREAGFGLDVRLVGHGQPDAASVAIAREFA